jgi:hypothetical protein
MNRRRNLIKKFVIIGIIFIVMLAMLFTVFRRSKDINEDAVLRNHIIEIINQENSIDFNNITNFEWDTMYLFTPDSIPKDIFKMDDIKEYNSTFNIEVRDDINMIAFVKFNRLISYVELPRKYGGESISKYIKFSKKNAKFKISQNDKVIIYNK